VLPPFAWQTFKIKKQHLIDCALENLYPTDILLDASVFSNDLPSRDTIR
jgi:hypothetical protein